jgi:hypothetical protein
MDIAEDLAYQGQLDRASTHLQQRYARLRIAHLFPHSLHVSAAGRAEDITLASQDFGDMSFSGDLEFHGMEEEIAAGDFGPPLEGGDVFGFGPGEIPPSPAAGGVEAPVEEEEDIFVGKRAGKAKKRKGAKAFVPVIDEETEMSAEQEQNSRAAHEALRQAEL